MTSFGEILKASQSNELTVNDRQITSIDTRLDPIDFSINIPEGYKGRKLPLWLISQYLNAEFNTLGYTGK